MGKQNPSANNCGSLVSGETLDSALESISTGSGLESLTFLGTYQARFFSMGDSDPYMNIMTHAGQQLSPYFGFLIESMAKEKGIRARANAIREQMIGRKSYPGLVKVLVVGMPTPGSPRGPYSIVPVFDSDTKSDHTFNLTSDEALSVVAGAKVSYGMCAFCSERGIGIIAYMPDATKSFGFLNPRAAFFLQPNQCYTEICQMVAESVRPGVKFLVRSVIPVQDGMPLTFSPVINFERSDDVHHYSFAEDPEHKLKGRRLVTRSDGYERKAKIHDLPILPSSCTDNSYGLGYIKRWDEEHKPPKYIEVRVLNAEKMAGMYVNRAEIVSNNGSFIVARTIL